MTLQRRRASTGQAGGLIRASTPGQGAEWQAVIQHAWDFHGVGPYPRGWMSPPPNSEAAARMTAIVNLHRGAASDSVVYYVDEKPISGVLAGGSGTAKGSGRRRHQLGVLFAALNPVSGRIIARRMGRQRSREFIRFLNVLDCETLDHHQVHVILDNFSPHKHTAVQKWLLCHARFKLHFSPAGMSWTNLVELFFYDLARRCLKWRVYRSVTELRTTVAHFIASACAEPRFHILAHPRAGQSHFMNAETRAG